MTGHPAPGISKAATGAMAWRPIRFALVCVWLLLTAIGGAVAQTAPETPVETPAEATPEQGSAGTELPETVTPDGVAPDAVLTDSQSPDAGPMTGATPTATPDATDAASVLDITWPEVSARAELIAENGTGSTFALQRLRGELVVWRDKFLTDHAVNRSRIATVNSQLVAIGAAPESGAPGEAPEVTARRAEIEAELKRLRAPVLLAEESYAHADGLIGEIDRMIRANEARQLMTRGPMPLNPALWPEVADAIQTRLTGLWKEIRISLTSDVRRQTLAQTWPLVLFLLAAAMVLLLRSRRWLRLVNERIVKSGLRGKRLLLFVVSLTQVLLPWIGLMALGAGLGASGMFGYRATQLINAMPPAGVYVLSALWLSGHFFNPDQANPSPFDFTPARKDRLRSLATRLGWVLAAGTIVQVFIKTGQIEQVVLSVVLLPFEILIGVILFQFGRELMKSGKSPTQQPGDADLLRLRHNLMVLGGRLVMVTAAIGPVLSMLGYTAAGAALLFPTITTLALVGIVFLLQWLVDDVYALITRSDSATRDALLPVLAGFAITLAALPILALIWGAKVEDLTEIWRIIRDGYMVGGTRISPAIIMTVGLVFAAGYMATRLVQSALRMSVLPKTKIDLGGQNAIVSGIGYTGIFLSALLAISIAGLDLSNLAIVAGALSVGIGFGLQTIVSNFVSGIILLIERPISEGDWIEVGGKMGYVRDISVRATRIETFDRTDVIIPNADLVAGQVVNWTRGNSVGRVIVPVSVAYGSDTDQVTAILREIAEAHPMVLLAPPPSVVLVNFGPDALNYEIRAIVRDVNFGLSVRSEMNQTIARRFFEEGIEIAGAARPNATPGRTARTEVPALPTAADEPEPEQPA